MKTQEITIQVKATVPVGDYCSDMEKRSIAITQRDVCNKLEGWGKPRCSITGDFLKSEYHEAKGKETNVIIYKCQACLDACDNGFQKGLDELSEGMEG